MVLHPLHGSRGRELLQPNIRVRRLGDWCLSLCHCGKGDGQDREECWAHSGTMPNRTTGGKGRGSTSRGEPLRGQPGSGQPGSRGQKNLFHMPGFVRRVKISHLTLMRPLWLVGIGMGAGLHHPSFMRLIALTAVSRTDASGSERARSRTSSALVALLPNIPRD